MIPVEQFLALAEQASLLSGKTLERLRSQAPPANGEAGPLVEQLVQDETLTSYQASVLMRGTIAGLRFDEYQVLDKLGTGAMAVVLKARHAETGQLAALKVLLPAAQQDLEAYDRFVRESEVGATLSHENIVAVYASRLGAEQKYLVMEYVDGPDLEAHVHQKGPLLIPEAVEYTLQAARGLAHAHANGIVHRDIKPGNLLINGRRQVKILDLGLVRVDRLGSLSEPSDVERLTQREAVLGTPHYMAPEQFLDARNADARADIYGLGYTLYFLLTGKRPYDRGTPMETLRAHLTEPVLELSDIRFDVPDKLEAAFSKMVAKQTPDRYQNMQEVMQALSPFGSQRPDGSSSPIRRWLGKLRGQ